MSGAGLVETRTINNPSGFIVSAESTRRGKGGSKVTIGFEDSQNRNLKLNGRQARALYLALSKHFAELGS